jgi:hypothetical protein
MMPIPRRSADFVDMNGVIVAVKRAADPDFEDPTGSGIPTHCRKLGLPCPGSKTTPELDIGSAIVRRSDVE